MKAVHVALPLFDYLNAQDPSGALVAKVYAGVHRVWIRMVTSGEMRIQRESQWSWDTKPTLTSAATVIQFLQTVMYAPMQEDALGSFCPYDHKHQPTIRVTTHKRSSKDREETILHEIAHAVQFALTGEYMSHGDEWTRIALLMGCVEASPWADE
jgi:hypothetical protein